jgi:hypothetical protein
VRENEGERIRALAALVNEMNSNAVHFGFKMRELVEHRFLFPPVKMVLPIIDELLEVIEIGACIPVCAFHVVRPPGVLKPLS